MNFSLANNLFVPMILKTSSPAGSSISSLTSIANQASEVLDNYQASGFFQSIIEGVKSFCKTIRHSPLFSWIFDSFQHDTQSLSAIDQAKSRNNSCSHDQLVKYHGNLEFNEKNPDGIYKSHFAPSGRSKGQVYLFLGHCQGFKDKQEETGILRIYEKLVKDNDCDVILFRVGCAMSDLKHIAGISSQTALKPDVVREHVANIIEDRNYSRGIFANCAKPANVVIAGYSWGAGLSKEILDRWNRIGNGSKVSTSLSLDGVQYGINNFADNMQVRPDNSGKHINIYQNNDLFINGSNLEGMDPSRGDVSVDVDNLKPGSSLQHTEIDDDPNIIDSMYKEIRESLSRSGGLVSQKV